MDYVLTVQAGSLMRYRINAITGSITISCPVCRSALTLESRSGRTRSGPDHHVLMHERDCRLCARIKRQRKVSRKDLRRG